MKFITTFMSTKTLYGRVELKKEVLNLDIAAVSNVAPGPNKHGNVI